MPEIVYRRPDGAERRIEVAEGLTVMLGAVRNDVRGIEAECGGSLACATCHVYVDPAFADRLPPPDADEEEMLSAVAAERRPNSRLSCQLKVTRDLDGLVVEIPDRQL
mgnify:CR=1 FL=1